MATGAVATKKKSAGHAQHAKPKAGPSNASASHGQAQKAKNKTRMSGGATRENKDNITSDINRKNVHTYQAKQALKGAAAKLAEIGRGGKDEFESGAKGKFEFEHSKLKSGGVRPKLPSGEKAGLDPAAKGSWMRTGPSEGTPAQLGRAWAMDPKVERKDPITSSINRNNVMAGKAKQFAKAWKDAAAEELPEELLKGKKRAKLGPPREALIDEGVAPETRLSEFANALRMRHLAQRMKVLSGMSRDRHAQMMDLVNHRDPITSQKNRDNVRAFEAKQNFRDYVANANQAMAALDDE